MLDGVIAPGRRLAFRAEIVDEVCVERVRVAVR